MTGHTKRLVQVRALLAELFYSATHSYLGYSKIFSYTSWQNTLYLMVIASSLNSKPRSCKGGEGQGWKKMALNCETMSRRKILVSAVSAEFPLDTNNPLGAACCSPEL